MSTSNTENIIEVENLVAHYGERVILNGINLCIRTGEIMVIMGGSGSGKTTLMRNLLGLNKPTSGSIHILGKDITKISKRELYAIRRKMGVAFQGGALLGSMSGYWVRCLSQIISSCPFGSTPNWMTAPSILCPA